MELEAQALTPIQYQSTRNKKNIKASTLNTGAPNGKF